MEIVRWLPSDTGDDPATRWGAEEEEEEVSGAAVAVHLGEIVNHLWSSSRISGMVHRLGLRSRRASSTFRSRVGPPGQIPNSLTVPSRKDERCPAEHRNRQLCPPLNPRPRWKLQQQHWSLPWAGNSFLRARRRPKKRRKNHSSHPLVLRFQEQEQWRMLGMSPLHHP